MKIRVKTGESLMIPPLHKMGRGAGGEAGGEVELEAGAHLHLTQVTFAENEQANSWKIIFLGENASCELYFLDLVKKYGNLRTEVEVFHNVPNCKSTQLHKGLYADDGQGFLRAYVEVAHGALGTNASQLHRSLLLSPNARVHAEPHLQIDADAVQCRHGASIGQLDPAALFYLRARGLDEKTAKNLLIRGFAGEVLSKIDDAKLRESFEEQVLAWI